MRSEGYSFCTAACASVIDMPMRTPPMSGNLARSGGLAAAAGAFAAGGVHGCAPEVGAAPPPSAAARVAGAAAPFGAGALPDVTPAAGVQGELAALGAGAAAEPLPALPTACLSMDRLLLSAASGFCFCAGGQGGGALVCARLAAASTHSPRIAPRAGR